MNATLTLGRQGRLVIPVEIRSALRLEPGDQLTISLVGDHLVLERPRDALAALQALGDGVPAGRSLVDELLAERRLAAATE